MQHTLNCEICLFAMINRCGTELVLHGSPEPFSEIFCILMLRDQVSNQMSTIGTYSNTTGRLLLALVLLAVSSGFTVAHHSCLMKQSQCCDAVASGGPMGNSRPIDGTSISRPSLSCCATTVSGGLSAILALIEKQSSAVDHRLTVAQLHFDFSPLFSSPTTEYTHFTQGLQTSPPPSVEKYVLFASLLI